MSKSKLAEVELHARLTGYDTQLKEHNGRIRFWIEEIGKLREQEEQDAEFDLSDDEDESGDEEDENEDDEDDEDDEEGGEKEEGEKEEEGDMDVTKLEGEEGEEAKAKKTKQPIVLPTLEEDDLLEYDRGELKRDIEDLEKEVRVVSASASARSERRTPF